MLALLAPFALALSLDDAWNAADSGSRELALVREQTVQSDALRTRAWALLQPKLVLGGNYTINQREAVFGVDFSEFLTEESLAAMEAFGVEFSEPEPFVVQEKRYLDWNASIVQPLFNGQALPLLQAAYANVEAGRATERALRADVRLGIAQAYWGVVVAREGEILAARALENAAAHLKMAETTTAVGTAPPMVRLQAEIGVARADRQLAQAREQVVVAEQAFARLTGLPPDTALDRPAPRAIPFSSLDVVTEAAVARHPEIIAANHQARAARLSAVATHLSWLPSLDGRFTEAFSQNSGFTGEPYNWMLVFSANWTLWDGGNRIALQTIAASQLRQAEVAADRAADLARERVRVAWERHARAEAAGRAVQKEIALAEENLRLAEVSFGVGSLSYLEMEDARLGVLAARLADLAETMNRDLAAIELLAAAGAL